MHIIPDILAHHARSSGNAEVAVEGKRRFTYGTLQADVGRAAKGLIALGVARGDRVGTLAPPSYDFLVSFLASASVGAIWVGINPRYRERDFRHILENARPKIVFAPELYDRREYLAELAALSGSPRYVSLGRHEGGYESRLNTISEGAAVLDSALSQAITSVQPTDPAVIVYTSGTTGAPKGAMLSQGAITEAALVNAAWMGDALARSIMAAPINHIGGLNEICMCVLVHGGTIFFYHRVDIVEIGRITLEEKPTYLVTSPTGFRMFLDMAGADVAQAFASYKLIVYGGSKTPRNILERFKTLDCRLVGIYTQTECTNIVTRTADDADLEVLSETIGEPLPGVQLRVVDPETLEPRQHGEIGELQVKANFQMSGYFENPGATAAAFTSDGFVRTGDLVVSRPDGNYEFVDRLKEMFKSGGYNVYPVEVEQAMCEHSLVSTAAVLSVPDEKFDEVGYGFYSVLPGAALSNEELETFLRQRIANYKIPKVLEQLEVMPLLPNTKVDRQALKSLIKPASKRAAWTTL
jgi:acyl-CoA synthetase (AMP-forming)/AMP-acid ligase II